jgi:hypothetical protein
MDAVRDITDASYNIGIGTYALSANTSGNYNLAIGYRAMAGTGTGDYNSAYGYDALRSLTSGASNIGIGKDAGDLITTGSNNIIIGNNAHASAVDVSNEIVIGAGANGLGANYAVIGSADVTRVYAAQDAGATLYAGGLNIGGTAVSSTAAELNYVDGVTSNVQTQINAISSSADINGGAIDGTTIGATSASTGVFTTLTSSGATSLATGGGVVNVSKTGVMTTVKGTLNVDEAVTLDSTLDVTGGKITSSTTSSDAYSATSFQDKSLLKLSSNNGENNYSGIQFTNSAGSYEMFIGSVQVASSAADIVFQGYDRGALAYKEYIRINDDANTTFAGTVTTGNLLSYGDGTNNNTFIQGRSSAGQYSGIKLARGSGNWSNAENNHFGMVITDNGLELAKFTALGDNATGKAVYMTMADGGNTTFGGTVTANGVVLSSDSRLKSKVQPLNLGLQFINKLSPVSYFKMSRSQYNGEEDNNDLSYEYGLIAQELEEVLKETDPENTVVTKGDDGLLGVSYMQLVMPLIKSVQELSSYVEELESNKSDEIQALKKEIELLKSMIKSQK